MVRTTGRDYLTQRRTSGTAYEGFRVLRSTEEGPGGQILHVIFWLDGTTVATVLLSDYLRAARSRGRWSAVRIPSRLRLGTASTNE